jgi:hypothetical protein
MTTTYKTIWGSDEIIISADWAQASSPIDGIGGKQVADFRHSPHAAMEYALAEAALADGSDPEDDDTEKGISAALADMEEEKSREEKITEGAEHIDAAKANDGDGYIYRAAETNMWYRVSEDDLVELSDLLHDKDDEIRGSAYSHWCAQTMCEEMTGEQAEAAGLID